MINSETKKIAKERGQRLEQNAIYQESGVGNQVSGIRCR